MYDRWSYVDVARRDDLLSQDSLPRWSKPTSAPGIRIATQRKTPKRRTVRGLFAVDLHKAGPGCIWQD